MEVLWWKNVHLSIPDVFYFYMSCTCVTFFVTVFVALKHNPRFSPAALHCTPTLIMNRKKERKDRNMMHKFKVDPFFFIKMLKKAFKSATGSINLCLSLSFLWAKCHLGYLIEHKTYHWEMKCSVGCGGFGKLKSTFRCQTSLTNVSCII